MTSPWGWMQRCIIWPDGNPCTWSCPLVIGSARTHGDTWSEEPRRDKEFVKDGTRDKNRGWHEGHRCKRWEEQSGEWKGGNGIGRGQIGQGEQDIGKGEVKGSWWHEWKRQSISGTITERSACVWVFVWVFWLCLRFLPSKADTDTSTVHWDGWFESKRKRNEKGIFFLSKREENGAGVGKQCSEQRDLELVGTASVLTPGQTWISCLDACGYSANPGWFLILQLNLNGSIWLTQTTLLNLSW